MRAKSTIQSKRTPTAKKQGLATGTVVSGTTIVRPQLVSAGNFVLATRDTGYKSTAHAVAEFIDNSVQAGAKTVTVDVVKTDDATYPLELIVTDDGAGMDATTLASALTFGGSSRFGDRSSLGRYGMGLPNGALSRARRVEVFTWQGLPVLTSWLDVDEIVSKGRRTLAPVTAIRRPAFVPRTPHGTVVRLLRCDRLEYKRMSTLINQLVGDLGRIYNRFLTRGLAIEVNGRSVKAVDPLFLQPATKNMGSRQFGETLVYRLPGADRLGTVEVRFSELPIERWHSMTSPEKRSMGITNAHCVSIVRADREIDRGWYFMGGKRRENYDDWWRCEISFDPSLDELFGITHAKQAISPRVELLEALAPDLESIARALNSRVRERFELVKLTNPLSAAERQAARAESTLPTLPRRRDAISHELRDLISRRASADVISAGPYQIMVTELPTTAAYEFVRRDRQLLLLLNARHPLYRDLYGPLAVSESDKDQDIAMHIALTVLAAARAEAGVQHKAERDGMRRFRQMWADVLATFYNA